MRLLVPARTSAGSFPKGTEASVEAVEGSMVRLLAPRRDELVEIRVPVAIVEMVLRGCTEHQRYRAKGCAQCDRFKREHYLTTRVTKGQGGVQVPIELLVELVTPDKVELVRKAMGEGAVTGLDRLLRRRQHPTSQTG
ncbi:hypothetical protein SEA_CAFASSO_46 [Gordonia phage Cafasso]|uniref:Uncharacterized protein n=1 Tax=Gordonia phage Cafasso TaxID=2851095 RepID=A0AAE7SIC2_9CAUD|nr:hypothetical protein SEA_CAFASSO_46 [Gordonia phage Cafasso]